MSMQIANPTVISKINALAKTMGLTKTAAVEKAVDELLAKRKTPDDEKEIRRQMDETIRKIHQVPQLPNPINPLEWDENGLPR